MCLTPSYVNTHCVVDNKQNDENIHFVIGQNKLVLQAGPNNNNNMTITRLIQVMHNHANIMQQKQNN